MISFLIEYKRDLFLMLFSIEKDQRNRPISLQVPLKQNKSLGISRALELTGTLNQKEDKWIAMNLERDFSKTYSGTVNIFKTKLKYDYFHLHLGSTESMSSTDFRGLTKISRNVESSKKNEMRWTFFLTYIYLLQNAKLKW